MTVKLTPREKQVVELVAEGLSNAEIADRLAIGVDTVKEHVRNCFDKLKVANRTALAVWHVKSAMQKGYDPQKAFIVLGSADTLRANQERCINEYEFDSVPELQAFLRGISVAIGWSDYDYSETREQAMTYIKDTILDADGDGGWWKFTAIDNGGNYESFDGYDSQADAAAAIDRLRLHGYTGFSAPERVTETANAE